MLLECNIVCTAIELTLLYRLLCSLLYTEFLDTFDKQRDTEKVCPAMTKMSLLQLFVLFVCLFVCLFGVVVLSNCILFVLGAY